MALNTSLPHGLSPCAQLSSCFPQEIGVRAAAPLSGEQTRGGGNGGEPWKEVGIASGPEPRCPCHELPRAWIPGSMLTFPHRQLHADFPPALSITDPEGLATCSPGHRSTELSTLTSLPKSEMFVHKQGQGPREGLLCGSKKTVFPPFSLVENPCVDKFKHSDCWLIDK